MEGSMSIYVYIFTYKYVHMYLLKIQSRTGKMVPYVKVLTTRGQGMIIKAQCLNSHW